LWSWLSERAWFSLANRKARTGVLFSSNRRRN
jgi:hypothetical protein